jgi:hypothetical protein
MVGQPCNNVTIYHKLLYLLRVAMQWPKTQLQIWIYYMEVLVISHREYCIQTCDKILSLHQIW